ncbi:hypothetical protein [Microbacterium sp. lyk4-40-TSB-66]|uniref:hypothetical protein n=1 Tax=Microbacterium sp. lyk4-40-TSB-66 TaxID=3040294 RepID=UPI0025505F05|nr:hypothetical protein [Microbacterium sp. lyk4-40-TSB-66]
MSAPPPDDAAGRRDRSPRAARTRVLAITDRVPTGWFAGILTALFLSVTAVFGGLSAVAVPPVPDIAAGTEHRNDQFALTVERAVLIDELPGSGTSVSDGQRVLALVVSVENVWDRALAASGDAGVADAVSVAELGGATANAVARIDDATVAPYLQPGVPAELVLTWAVDPATFAAGDVLHVDLLDFTSYTGQLVTYGESWIDPVVGARTTVEISDVGAGADSASGSESGSGSSEESSG